MSFFVVMHDTLSGELRLLDQCACASRADALSALQSLVEDGSVPQGEPFICDLDTATPVLFINPSPTAEIAPAVQELSQPDAAQEPIETDSFVIEEPFFEDVPTAEVEPIEELSAVIPEQPAAVIAPLDDLATALRRATRSLQADAIAEMPAIEPEPEAVSPGLHELADALDQFSAPAVDDEPFAEVQPELTPEPPVRVEWPWSVDVPPVAQPAAPSAEEHSTFFEPQPVILGEYVETPAFADEPQPEQVLLPEQIAEAEQVPQPEPEVELEPAPEVEPEVETGLPDQSALESNPEPAVHEPAGYEAGNNDLSQYGCQECVYENTCPKAGTSTPAECGTFQWKSV